MAQQGVIYKITSPSNKIYIGQSVNFKVRLRKYKSLNCKAQIKLYNSFLKYGFENHDIVILLTCNINELNNKERYFQELYNCIDKGLNCLYTKTDIKKSKLSKETRNKMSLARKGKKLSKITKERMSKSQKKAVKTYSKESKKIMADRLSKKVIDTKTKIIYNSIKEAAEDIGINKNTLYPMLRGENTNKTNLKYYGTAVN